MKPSPGMSNTTRILVVVVIILVAAIGIAMAMILLTKEPLANNSTNNTNVTGNFTPQSTTTTNKQVTSSSSSDIQNSVNGVDQSGYRLVDVRRSSDTGNVRCQFCGEWTVLRTVYEYENSAGERIMIGENYCTICGRTSKDFWQRGVWSDL